MYAISGNPAINLAQAVETNGGTGYLTDTNIAAAQVEGNSFLSPSYKFANISPTSPYVFATPLRLVGGQNNYYLFEGAGIGEGELVLTISEGTNIVAQTGEWLDLRDVKNMYERVQITGVTNPAPPTSGFLPSAYEPLNAVPSGPGEDTNIIVFVHGWRMGGWDYYSFSESMFKRLYWQGYHGRFVSIRWDTLSADDFQPIPLGRDYFTYNASEYRAWESAKGVSDYLTALKQRFPNYNLNVCAHSMGNIVMAEALKLQLAAGQQNVNNYVLMQAAVPASCYDTSFTNYVPFIQAEAETPTPNTYQGYPGAINGAVSGRLVDFYNTNDYALATGTLPWYGLWLTVNWEANQKHFKPDSGYLYTTDGTNCYVLLRNQNYRTVTDSHEIMAFCARPRSKAVGAQPGVAGVIQGGSVDLTANFSFKQGSDQHSAQFNWPIQQVSGFYAELMADLLTQHP
jgi:pimeloyl-ACP methyl ester carboxylesterase